MIFSYNNKYPTINFTLQLFSSFMYVSHDAKMDVCMCDFDFDIYLKIYPNFNKRIIE